MVWAAALSVSLLLVVDPGSGGDAAPRLEGPGSHARMLEAFAVHGVQPSTPMAVVAVNARQRSDPHFAPLAQSLTDALRRRGFNVVGKGQRFIVAVTLAYRVYRDTDGVQPGQSEADPRVQVSSGPAKFPANRRLTVTAYDLSDRADVKLLWRTAMEEEGFDQDAGRTLPGLIAAGGRYYGQSRTALAMADCGDASALGSHIPSSPCGPARAALSQPQITRQPKVTVGPLSVPQEPAVAPRSRPSGPGAP